MFVGRSVGGAERPNALGTLIGAMLVSTLENGLTICAVPFYVLPAVKGRGARAGAGCSLRHQKGAVIVSPIHRRQTAALRPA